VTARQPFLGKLEWIESEVKDMMPAEPEEEDEEK
jgi:hypothetical protein